jgi:drug/metabolite transporter (DMT)-like permease
MRGLAPLLVAVGSGPLIGETLPAATWLGVAGISAGVLLVGLSRGAGMAQARALRFALANAALVGLYTIVDGRGVRASGNALQYVGAFFLTNGLPYFLIVMWRRGSRRPAAWAYMRARWKLAFVGTAAALLSYGIALWAMTRAPVAAVAALRETSVLFAAVIGTRWLAEGFGWQRAAGTVLIVAGVVVLRLV